MQNEMAAKGAPKKEGTPQVIRGVMIEDLDTFRYEAFAVWKENGEWDETR